MKDFREIGASISAFVNVVRSVKSQIQKRTKYHSSLIFHSLFAGAMARAITVHAETKKVMYFA